MKAYLRRRHPEWTVAHSADGHRALDGYLLNGPDGQTARLLADRRFPKGGALWWILDGPLGGKPAPTALSAMIMVLECDTPWNWHGKAHNPVDRV